MNLDKELEKQGLNQKQIKVYLAVLGLGRATIIDIARKTAIKRTTVYDVVLQLIQLEFVSESKRGKRRLFIAENPGLLLTKMEQKLNELKGFVPTLSSLYAGTIPRPEIKFYDGINGVRNIMEELLLMKDKEQLYWSSIEDLIDLFGPVYMKNWVIRRVKRNIWSKVLLVKRRRNIETHFQESNMYLRKIHWLPGAFNFNGIICLFDNKIAFISSREESFGFVVKSDELSRMMRLIFDSMWQITK
jgi:HTH-type transcriptional regulator, sugar sensing transcriptional regulator